MTAELVPSPAGAGIVEQVVIKGDLAKLTPDERVAYYAETCKSLGLNPLTRPFEYITLNGRLTLYATRGATDQLRTIRGITITGLDPKQIGDLMVVVASGRDREGREDSATGAVSVKGLVGENLANAMMKAETKAKRRLTLSLAGLGFPDESEISSIPSAEDSDIDPLTGHPRRPPTLAERAAAKAAALPEPVVVVLSEPEPSESVEDEPGEAETPADFTEALDDADVEARFKAAVRAAKVSREEVGAAARRAFGGIPSTAYTARHWQGLADELGLTL